MAKGTKLNLYSIFACTATILAASWVLAEVENCEMDEIEDEALRVEVAFAQAGLIDNCLPVAPEAILGVKFPTVQADLGNCLYPCSTILTPLLELEGDPETNLTVAIMDRDMPSAATPILSNYLMYLCLNVNGSSLSTFDSSLCVAPWINANPTPGSGKHRIMAIAFPQSSFIDSSSLYPFSIDRYRFNMSALIANYSLGAPVAGNFWRTSIPKDYGKYCGIETTECCAKTGNQYY
ncbi:26 kDa secreted antigen-like [Bicyclus anynana]|uniref:26 kDa secreted antigen-like n=1 Tax=Bicyclus anynana TaxID=110368 RepID=A0A6J1NL18_BICAN|nr:26 kDa secreted antigen-like [Bicyclus anynana]